MKAQQGKAIDVKSCAAYFTHEETPLKDDLKVINDQEMPWFSKLDTQSNQKNPYFLSWKKVLPVYEESGEENESNQEESLVPVNEESKVGKPETPPRAPEHTGIDIITPHSIATANIIEYYVYTNAISNILLSLSLRSLLVLNYTVKIRVP